MKYLLENTRPRVFRIASLTLFPGVNEVEPTAWDKVAKHYAVKESFNEGHLRWVPGGSPEDAPRKADKAAGGPYPLKKMSPTDAINVVKKTTSVGTLEQWLEAESRKPVTSAIEKQLAEIKKAEEDEEEKKELAKLGQKQPEGGK